MSSYFTSALDAGFITLWLFATGGVASPFHPLWIASVARATGATLLTTDKDFDHLHPTHLQRVWIDPASALTLTNSLALGTLPTLPPNTLPPVVMPFDPTGTLPLGILTVSNPKLDEARVKDLARIEFRLKF